MTQAAFAGISGRKCEELRMLTKVKRSV